MEDIWQIYHAGMYNTKQWEKLPIDWCIFSIHGILVFRVR